jgi:undecaprenyl-diphosphatase
MDLRELFVAAVLGLVEGLTEFAPVSSTGHMILVDDFLLHSKNLFGSDIVKTFEVVIQLGAILAVVVLFRARFLWLLGLAHAKPIRHLIQPRLSLKSKDIAREPNSQFNLIHIIAGLLPAGIFGFIFNDFIDEHLFNAYTVLAALVVGALWMIVADWLYSRFPKVKTVDQMTLPKAFIIGVLQCLSLWPGFSRSGSTISAGIVLGLSYRTASDFSFMMAVPIMLAASLLTLVKHPDVLTPGNLPFFLVGFIIAFLSALLAIQVFLKLISRIKLVPFAIYRFVLAAILLWVIISFPSLLP